MVGRAKPWKFQRINFVEIFFFLFCLTISFRLFNLQVLQHKYYYALAFHQHEIIEKIIPERGKIFVKEEYSQELFPIATNQKLYLLYADPREIKEPKITAEKIAEVLSLETTNLINTDKDAKSCISTNNIKPCVSVKSNKKEIEEEILKKIIRNPKDPYEPLKDKIDKETFEKIKNLNLEGIYFKEETWRYYPEKNMASHILGFVGFEKNEKKGRYGIEEYFEKILKGKEGEFSGEKDPFGRIIPFGKKFLKKAENGAEIVLTIDKIVQYVTEEKLKNQVEKHLADSGSVIVLNSQTGEILAMAAFPNFDPNQFSKEKNINIFNNPNISSCYEPGSVFKPITMSVALEEKKITPETTYTDEGFVQIGSYTIKNAADKTFGVQTMTQVLENSINTGVIFAIMKVKDKFYQYIKQFGFGQLTGIELPSEAKGYIDNLKENRDIYFATASFGQGVCMTPIQLVSAINAIANKGELIKPRIVSEINYPDGKIEKKELELDLPVGEVEKKRVISEKTAQTLSAMMISVVEKGHGKKAGIPGYWVAGKTGTAEVPKKDRKGYESGQNIGSFVGFLPANEPRFTILVKIDNPRNVQWAETSAAPLFRNIAKFLVDYYKIKPTR